MLVSGGKILALSKIEKNETLTGNGTPSNPLSVSESYTTSAQNWVKNYVRENSGDTIPYSGGEGIKVEDHVISLEQTNSAIILEYGDDSTYDDVLAMLNEGKRVLVNVDPFYSNDNAIVSDGVQKYPISPFKVLLQGNVPTGNPYIDFTGYVSGNVYQVAHVQLWNSSVPSIPSKINNWCVNDVNPTQLARAFEVSELNTRVNTEEAARANADEAILNAAKNYTDTVIMDVMDESIGSLKEEFANFIWADYGTGNDENDGLSPLSPVKTLEKAAALAATHNRKIHTLNSSGNSTYFEIHNDISNDIRLESFGSVYFYRYDNGHKLNGSLEVTVKGSDDYDSISIYGFSEITGKSIRLTAKSGYVQLGNGSSTSDLTTILENEEVLLSSKKEVYAYFNIPNSSSRESVVTLKSEDGVYIYGTALSVTKLYATGEYIYVGGSDSNRNAPYTATNGFEIFGTKYVYIYSALSTDQMIKIRSNEVWVYGNINGKAADSWSYGYPGGGTLDIESVDGTYLQSGAVLKIANIKLSSQAGNIQINAVSVFAQSVNIEGQEVYLGENPWYVQKSLVARAETGNLSFSNGGIFCDHIKGYAGKSLLIRGSGLFPGYYKYADNSEDRELFGLYEDSYCILESDRDINNDDGGIYYISQTKNDKIERKRFWKVSLKSSHISFSAKLYGAHVSLNEEADGHRQIELNQHGIIYSNFAKLNSNRIRYNYGAQIFVGRNPNEDFTGEYDLEGDTSYLKCNLLTKTSDSPLVLMHRSSDYYISSEQDFHFDVGMVDVSENSKGGGSYFAWVDQADSSSGIPFTGNISGRVGGFITGNSDYKFRPYPHDYKFIGSGFIVNGLNNTGTISLHVDPYIGPMDLYWDPNFGHDNADGLSKSTAVKTPAGIDKALKALSHSSVLVLHVLTGSGGSLLGNFSSETVSGSYPYDSYGCFDMNQVFEANGISTLEIRSEVAPIGLGLKNWWRPSGMMTWITGFKALALDMTSIPKGSIYLGNLFAETEDLIHMWGTSESARPLRFDNLCLSAKSGTVRTEYLGAGSFIIHDSQYAYAKQPYLTQGSIGGTNLSMDAKQDTIFDVDGYYLGDGEFASGDISLKGKTVNYNMRNVGDFRGFVSIHADGSAAVTQNYGWRMTMDVYAGNYATLSLGGNTPSISGSISCKAGNSISFSGMTNHTNVRLDAPTINFNSGCCIFGEPENGSSYTETKIKAATLNANDLQLYGGDFYIDCTELRGSLKVGGGGPDMQPETTLYANIEKISNSSMGMITIYPTISTSEIVKAFIDVKEIEGYTIPSSGSWRSPPWLSSSAAQNQETFGKICVYANVQKSGSSINDSYSDLHYAEGSEWKVNYLDRFNPSTIQTSLAGNEDTKLLRLGEYNTFETSKVANYLNICVPDPKLSRSSTIQESKLQEAAFEFTVPEGSSVTAESIKFYSVYLDDYVYVNTPKGLTFNFTPGDTDVPMEVTGLEALAGPGDTVVGVVINHRVMCTVFHPTSA